jgi:hypothetical protein
VLVGLLALARWVPLTVHSQAAEARPGRPAGGGDTLGISGWTFVPENDSTAYEIDGGGGIYMTGGSYPSDTRVHAPVHLPDGVQVTGITFYCFDTVAADMSAVLLRNNDAYLGASYPLAEAWSSGSGGYGNISDTIDTPETIDNERYNYEVRVTWWSATDGADLKLMSVAVHYTN